MLVIRPAILPADAPAIEALDTAFTTHEIYEVDATFPEIHLRLKALSAPFRKRFPLDDLQSLERPYTDAWVALRGVSIVGFAASSFEAWNRRLVLWHCYVDPTARRQGVGRGLIEAVKAHGIKRRARHIWLETSSVNVPGVAAYSALGFTLSGVDLTLYDGTDAEGEIALFYSQRLPSA